MAIYQTLVAGVGLNTTTIVVSSSLCILVYLVFRRDRRNLPPSPGVALPLIGHLHHMREDMRVPCRKLRQQLGDVYTLQLGARLAVVVSDYDTIKEAFVKHADTFAERPRLMTVQAVTRGHGFIESNGPQWKEHRRFILTVLKDLGMGRRILEGKVQKEAATLAQQFRDTNETAFYPRTALNTAVANVISSMVFGDTYEHGEPLIEKMLKIVEENMKFGLIAGVLNFLPFLRWVPGDKFKLKHIVNNSNNIHDFVNEIVAKHDREGSEANDLVNAYLRAMEEKKANGEDTSFSLANLAGSVADLFFAGSETTTTALTWCLMCLVEHPDVQQKLYGEVIKHLGKDGVASLADKTKLTYVEAFYMEVLRLCDISPVLPTHATARDTTLKGYTIPTEAMIFVDMDSVLSDPKIWGDPERFRPERFLDQDGKLTRKEEYIAFFLGRRSCVGESLARMELFIILCCLVQQFEFRCPEGETISYEALDGSFGFTHAPKPFKIIAKKRK